MCCFKPDIPLNVFGHNEQLNLRSESCTSRLCCLNSTNVENARPHVSQANFPFNVPLTPAHSFVWLHGIVALLSFKNINLESSTMNLKLCIPLQSSFTLSLEFDALASVKTLGSLDIAVWSAAFELFTHISFGWFWKWEMKWNECLEINLLSN